MKPARPERVVATFGGSPLAAVAGVLALRPSTAVLAATDRTRTAARDACQVLKACGIDDATVGVPLRDHSSSTLRGDFETYAKDGGDLVYTGGTKAMAGAAVRAWRECKSGECWDVRAGVRTTVRASSGNECTVNVDLSLDQMLKLHDAELRPRDGWHRFELSTDARSLITAWRAENRSPDAQAAEQILKEGESPHGEDLRAWIAQLLAEVAGKHDAACELVVNPAPARGRPPAQGVPIAGVLGVLGAQLIVTAGGTGLSDAALARRLYYAHAGRASRLGGPVAPALVVTGLEDKGDKQHLTWTRERLHPGWDSTAADGPLGLFGRDDLRLWADGDLESLEQWLVPQLED